MTEKNTTKTTKKANAKAESNAFFPAFDANEFFTAAKLPAFDVNALFDLQRKNVEAVAEANRVAFEGYKALAERQGEIVKTNIAKVTEVANDVFAGKAANEDLDTYVERAKDELEGAVGTTRELAEETLKVNQEAFDILKARVEASVEEYKAVANF